MLPGTTIVIDSRGYNMNTHIDVAVKVLRLAGKPLHYSEITKIAIEKNLLGKTNGTPEVTMGVRLATEVRHKSPLARVRSGVFGLQEWSVGSRAVALIADKLGVQIVDRDATATWQYDGHDTANHHTNTCSGAKVNFTEAELLHELAHFAVAEPVQREFPEYGLMMGVGHGGYGPKGGEFRDDAGAIRYGVRCTTEGLVDKSEQNHQEFMVWVLTAHWGIKYQIPCNFPDASEINSWEEYFHYKVVLDHGDVPAPHILEGHWIALIAASKLFEWC